MAADRTPAQDMVTFPWGTNHVTKAYFAGADFAMQTIFEVSRVEKLATIAAEALGLPFLSFCRRHKVMPSNCGRCGKCVRTKAMFAAATGSVPEIYIDNTFHEDLMKRIELDGRERAHVLDLYCYAKEHGRIDAVPGLMSLVKQCRETDSSS